MATEDLIPFETRPVTWHDTFIRFGESVDIVKCLDHDCVSCEGKIDLFYHCPFCLLSSSFATLKDVHRHLDFFHWPTGVQFKDLLIIACKRICSKAALTAGHYHCPLCTTLVEEQSDFLTHLQNHLKDKNENVEFVYIPDTECPASMVYKDYTITLCEEDCMFFLTGNKEGRKKGHYHCPACNNIRMKRTDMTGHLGSCTYLEQLQHVQYKKDAILPLGVKKLPRNPREEFPMWQKSIVRTPYDIPLRRCVKNSCCNKAYHCPLCVLVSGQFMRTRQALEHLRSHVHLGIFFKGYTYLACNLECGDDGVKEFHYHCGYCGLLESNKNKFELHLRHCWCSFYSQPVTLTSSKILETESVLNPQKQDTNQLSLQYKDLSSQIEESSCQADDDSGDVEVASAVTQDEKFNKVENVYGEKVNFHKHNVKAQIEDKPSSKKQVINVDNKLATQYSGYKMFDSVSATFSPGFINAFDFSSKEAAEELFTTVAGASSVTFMSSPGIDPRNPVFSVQGSLKGVLESEAALHKELQEKNELFASLLSKPFISDCKRFMKQRNAATMVHWSDMLPPVQNRGITDKKVPLEMNLQHRIQDPAKPKSYSVGNLQNTLLRQELVLGKINSKILPQTLKPVQIVNDILSNSNSASSKVIKEGEDSNISAQSSTSLTKPVCSEAICSHSKHLENEKVKQGGTGSSSSYTGPLVESKVVHLYHRDHQYEAVTPRQHVVVKDTAKQTDSLEYVVSKQNNVVSMSTVSFKWNPETKSFSQNAVGSAKKPNDLPVEEQSVFPTKPVLRSILVAKSASKETLLTRTTIGNDVTYVNQESKTTGNVEGVLTKITSGHDRVLSETSKVVSKPSESSSADCEMVDLSHSSDEEQMDNDETMIMEAEELQESIAEPTVPEKLLLNSTSSKKEISIQSDPQPVAESQRMKTRLSENLLAEHEQDREQDELRKHVQSSPVVQTRGKKRLPDALEQAEELQDSITEPTVPEKLLPNSTSSKKEISIQSDPQPVTESQRMKTRLSENLLAEHEQDREQDELRKHVQSSPVVQTRGKKRLPDALEQAEELQDSITEPTVPEKLLPNSTSSKKEISIQSDPQPVTESQRMKTRLSENILAEHEQDREQDELRKHVQSSPVVQTRGKKRLADALEQAEELQESITEPTVPEKLLPNSTSSKKEISIQSDPQPVTESQRMKTRLSEHLLAEHEQDREQDELRKPVQSSPVVQTRGKKRLPDALEQLTGSKAGQSSPKVSKCTDETSQMKTRSKSVCEKSSSTNSGEKFSSDRRQTRSGRIFEESPKIIHDESHKKTNSSNQLPSDDDKANTETKKTAGMLPGYLQTTLNTKFSNNSNILSGERKAGVIVPASVSISQVTGKIKSRPNILSRKAKYPDDVMKTSTTTSTTEEQDVVNPAEDVGQAPPETRAQPQVKDTSINAKGEICNQAAKQTINVMFQSTTEREQFISMLNSSKTSSEMIKCQQPSNQGSEKQTVSSVSNICTSTMETLLSKCDTSTIQKKTSETPVGIQEVSEALSAEKPVTAVSPEQSGTAVVHETSTVPISGIVPGEKVEIAIDNRPEKLQWPPPGRFKMQKTAPEPISSLPIQIALKTISTLLPANALLPGQKVLILQNPNNKVSVMPLTNTSATPLSSSTPERSKLTLSSTSRKSSATPAYQTIVTDPNLVKPQTTSLSKAVSSSPLEMSVGQSKPSLLSSKNPLKIAQSYMNIPTEHPTLSVKKLLDPVSEFSLASMKRIIEVPDFVSVDGMPVARPEPVVPNQTACQSMQSELILSSTSEKSSAPVFTQPFTIEPKVINTQITRLSEAAKSSAPEISLTKVVGHPLSSVKKLNDPVKLISVDEYARQSTFQAIEKSLDGKKEPAFNVSRSIQTDMTYVREPVQRKKEPALNLPDFLKRQSFYLPSVQSNQAFPGMDMVLDRTGSWERTLRTNGMFDDFAKSIKFHKYPVFDDDLQYSKENSAKSEIELLLEENGQDFLSSFVVQNSEPSNCACPICSEQFHTPGYMLSHMLTVHVKFKCLVCFSMFTERKSLVNHMKRCKKPWGEPQGEETGSVTKQRCGECCEVFDTRKLLDQHQLSKHEYQPRCLICSPVNICTTFHKLFLHIETDHFGNNRIPCDICGKFFAAKNLYGHRKRHTDARVFQCPTCGKIMKDKQTLRAHEELHKPLEEQTFRYTCEYCGKRYRNKSAYKDHVNMKHTEEKTHECKECGMKFKAAVKLSKHKYTKHTIRQFKCEICDRPFKFKLALRSHMFIHTGESKHQCSLCGRRFGNPHVLKSHIPRCERNNGLGTWRPARKKNDKKDNPSAPFHKQKKNLLPQGSDAVQEATKLDYGEDKLEIDDLVDCVDDDNDYVYMCSACNTPFSDIGSAEKHITYCVV